MLECVWRLSFVNDVRKTFLLLSLFKVKFRFCGREQVFGGIGQSSWLPPYNHKHYTRIPHAKENKWVLRVSVGQLLISEMGMMHSDDCLYWSQWTRCSPGLIEASVCVFTCILYVWSLVCYWACLPMCRLEHVYSTVEDVFMLQSFPNAHMLMLAFS